jgi:DNA-binding XRE family transcriptional regulator
MEISSEIKALREKAGLTQGELATKAGISRASIHKYETGRATAA